MFFRSPFNPALLAIAAALAAAPVAAFAHHSFAPYDANKAVTLEGTVADFEWKNPHTFLALRTKTGDWALEGSSPNTLTRAGWKRAQIKVGDKLKVMINPRRDGSKAGFLKGLTLADGQTMGQTTATPPK